MFLSKPDGWLHIAIVLSMCVVFSPAAQAQVGASYTSIEAMVAGAVAVVRGSIIKLSRKVIIPKRGKRADGTPLPDGLVEYTLTVAVREVLKGDEREEVVVLRETSAYDDRCEQWRAAETEFLWFLGGTLFGNCTDGDRKHKWTAVRLGDSVTSERHYKIHAPPIFSMDFRVLKQGDEILAAARQAAQLVKRSPQNPIQLATVRIPRSVAEKCRSSGDANSFTVPIVKELEPIAKNMVSAPEKLDPDFARHVFEPNVLRAGGIELLAKLNANADSKK